jgi:hypothetical protein
MAKKATFRGRALAPEESQTALLVTDEQMIALLGIPADVARAAIRDLDRDPRSGFPQKIPSWGERRWWPAVVGYFEHRYGFGSDAERGRTAEQARTTRHEIDQRTREQLIADAIRKRDAMAESIREKAPQKRK